MRCATRSIRSSDEHTRFRPEPEGLVPPRQAPRRRGGARHQLRRPGERHARAGRRVGLGQERLGDVDRPAAAGERDRRRRQPDLLRGPQPALGLRRRTAQDPRQGHLGHLPGADDVAEPGLHGGLADRGSAEAAHRPRGPRAGRPRARADERGRHSRAEGADRRLSPRVVGRAAAARDDRDGDRVRTQAADRRRADHRARRDRPAPDPRADGAPAGQAPHEHAVHQPRPRAGRRDRRQRRRDARRHGARIRAGRPDLREPARRLHEGAARLPSAAGREAAAAAGDRRLHAQRRRRAADHGGDAAGARRRSRSRWSRRGGCARNTA